MKIEDARFLIVNFGAGQLAAQAFSLLGWPSDIVEMHVADSYGERPEDLSRLFAPLVTEGALPVIAFDTARGPTEVNWDEQVHSYLARCFTFVRALGPVVRTVGNDIVVMLPVTALIPDPRRRAVSTLHRALLGLFESLRAELLDTNTRVSIVLIEPNESAQDLGPRILDAIATRAMYSLPRSVSKERIKYSYDPMLAAAEKTPCAPQFPLPPTPMGQVYALEIGP